MECLLAVALIAPLAVAWLFWTELKGAGWQPAPKSAIESALRLANVGPGDVFYDLGAGTGRVVAAAAKTGANAVGVEIDPLRFVACKLRLKTTGIEGRARVILSDLFHVPLNDASVVFAYLRGWSTQRLKQKFAAELKPGARIITHFWKIEGWHPVAHDKENNIYVYKI